MSIETADDDIYTNDYIEPEPVYFMPVEGKNSKATCLQEDNSANTRPSEMNNYSLEAYPTKNANSREPQLDDIAFKDKRSHPSPNKALICLFISIIVMACVIIICFAVAFSEISKLRSETSSSSSSPAPISTSSLQQLIMELNESISLELNQDISALNTTLTLGFQGQSRFLPAPSCAAILSSDPFSASGNYWVTSSNGSAVRVYCDMTRSCGNITGGWTRVASLDLRDNNTMCPNGFRENIINTTTNTAIRTCVTASTSETCVAYILPTLDLSYSSVCGKIIAYQFGATNAFFQSPPQIDTFYVDGVSLTHGNPRQHIWTFAAGLQEASIPNFTPSLCPCFDLSGPTPPPSFVGNDYFCDTGSTDQFDLIFYGDDPLWDGDGCEGINTCCSFNNPPWFFKKLPQDTTDDIEMRLCRNDDTFNEDIAVEIVDIYVQ